MDPFLPGEIPVMVLRYLAANHCTDTAMKLIDEMPRLKDYIPAKPAHISEQLYLKHILRSGGNPGLKEMLWDYRNSKILVEDMLGNDEDMFLASTSQASLLSQIKTVQDKLKCSEKAVSDGIVSYSSERKESINVPVILKVDNFTSTDNFECPECLARKLQAETKTDASCQTEEYTAVQFGLQDEIPIIFYEKLLNDNNLQQKIAQTINEHMEDPNGEKNEKISKISSKAETEIDKFLVDLLQDMPDDSISLQSEAGLFQHLAGSASFADIESIEKNLSSMFEGDDMENIGNKNPTLTVSNSVIEQENSSPPSLPEQGTSTVEDANTGNSEKSFSSPVPERDESREVRTENIQETIMEFMTPTGASGNPKPPRRHQSIKRITPTPLSNASANPVFNTSVIIEKKLLEMGDKSAKISVITSNVEKPNWEKLSRRSIAPKIPSSPKITHNVTIDVKDSDEVIKLPNAKTSTVASSSKANEAFSKSKTRASSAVISDKSNPNPPSAHKRKATPVKLTPEKAKNTDYNFMHFYHDSNKKPVSAPILGVSESACIAKTGNEADSAAIAKMTPVVSNSSTVKQNEKASDSCSRLVLNENSQHDVTPMQPPPTHDSLSDSTLKTISPNALHRLIASANKQLQSTNTAACNFRNKKKSFSTPRKRKHVRSLNFATPPSLKTTTPGSEPDNIESVASQKRKASEELFSAERKSKKRLNWSESETQHSSSSNSTIATSRKVSRSVVESSTVEPLQKNVQTEVVLCNQPETAELSESEPAPRNTSVQKLPTILEESLSNMNSASSEEQKHSNVPSSNMTVAVSGGYPYPQQMYPTLPNREVFDPPKQLTILTIPTVSSDGSTYMQYFQLAEDMQTLIPISVAASAPVQGVSEETRYRQHSSQSNLSVNEAPPTVHETPTFQNSPSTSSNYPPPSVDTHTHTTSSIRNANSTVGSPQVVNSLRLAAPSNSSSYSTSPIPNSSTCPTEISVHTTSSDCGNLQTVIHSRQPRTNYDEPYQKPTVPPASIKSQSNLNSKPLPTTSSNLESLQHSELNLQCSEETPPSPPRHSSRNRAGKERQNKKPQKPKTTLNIQDLFGKSPSKGRSDKSKLPAEVIAAQRVAAEAVPLGKGNLRRSPRKHPPSKEVEPVTAMKVHPNVQLTESHIQDNRTRTGEKVAQPAVAEHTETTESQSKLSNSSEQQQDVEQVVFNIVPAPLGFPEPTPIKNFAETGTLNVSGITCNYGSLVTPFKSDGPPGPALNDTHFTLPPTPRVLMEDNDSNSTQSMKLVFEGLYPANLLTSTPLKSGIPRTPGRESSSSNSQSPVQLGKTGTSVQSVKNQTITLHRQDPTYSVPMQSQASVLRGPVSTISVPSTVSISTTVSAVATSSSLGLPSLNKDKSDGELSSSDDEDKSKQRNQIVLSKIPQKQDRSQQSQSVEHQHPHPHPGLQPEQPRTKGSAITSGNTSSNENDQQKQYRPRSVPLQPLPHGSFTIYPNLRQTHGINFNVGGREKHLTMSEKETLYSLITMSSSRNGEVAETRKENPIRPMIISHAALAPASQKAVEDKELSTRPSRNSLNKLVNVARKKTQTSRDHK